MGSNQLGLGLGLFLCKVINISKYYTQNTIGSSSSGLLKSSLVCKIDIRCAQRAFSKKIFTNLFPKQLNLLSDLSNLNLEIHIFKVTKLFCIRLIQGFHRIRRRGGRVVKAMDC